MSAPSKRGGARPGAGRPVAGTAPYKIRIPPAVAELIRASTGCESLSAAIVFNIITTGGTVEGAFLSTIATLGATTGTLFSAGMFTGGAKVVAPGDTLNVSYSLSI